MADATPPDGPEADTVVDADEAIKEALESAGLLLQHARAETSRLAAYARVLAALPGGEFTVDADVVGARTAILQAVTRIADADARGK